MPFLAVSTTVPVLDTTDCTGGSISDNSSYLLFPSSGALKNLTVILTLIPCVSGVRYSFSIVSLAISSIFVVFFTVFQCLCICFSISLFYLHFSFYSLSLSLFSVFLSSFALIFLHFSLFMVHFLSMQPRKFPQSKVFWKC
jgi:hypothetical protein